MKRSKTYINVATLIVLSVAGSGAAHAGCSNIRSETYGHDNYTQVMSRYCGNASSYVEGHGNTITYDLHRGTVVGATVGDDNRVDAFARQGGQVSYDQATSHGTLRLDAHRGQIHVDQFRASNVDVSVYGNSTAFLLVR